MGRQSTPDGKTVTRARSATMTPVRPVFAPGVSGMKAREVVMTDTRRRWLGCVALCIACAISCGDDDDAPPRDGGAPTICTPTGAEVCDSEQRDEDCDPTTLGELDRDEDGANDARCCNTDGHGAIRCGDDCHDLAAGVDPDGRDLRRLRQ